MSITTTHPESTDAALSTYRAAVVHEFNTPLMMEDVARPELATGQVLVKVEASGLCHTDIHAAHGDWPVKPSPPFIPGHEGVGIVLELGPGVTEVALGDRVAMARIRVRHLRLLRVGVGDPVPGAEEHGLFDRWHLR